ncbi:hypothetical protein DN820_10735 [Stutzerimonas nosocomialis]|uniref:Lipoprotein n=1 Tax=Stutzerimonas nosocomialis TaxID=1056496 RepID=A0A5R9QF02_9GAMM|nr:hypothetical protein [Stutzerimonas nosocomialis]TLX63560.1 hypothetical protein DN820_10735 [Stutzerimonas nosocomialis]
MGRPLLQVALVLALAGCSAPQALRPHIDQDPAALLKAYGYRVEVDVTEARLVQGDVRVDGQKMVERALNTAPVVQVSGQGGSAGASAAGVMIGSLLVSQLNRSRVHGEARNEADQQVAPLRMATAGTGLDSWFERQLRDQLDLGTLGPVKDASPYLLRFEPQAELGNDFDSTRLITEITLSFGHEVLYKGRIEVLGAAPWKADTTANIGLAPWLKDQAQPYRDALRANLVETLRILAMDLESGHFADAPGREQTLRYSLGAGRYVERGRLLADDGQRALFMDLRGWLKSVPLQAAAD